MRSTFLATVLLVSFAGHAVADECDDYGAQAVAAVAQATKLGCLGMTSDGWSQGPVSISGPRWSPNLSDHVNFCRANPSPKWNTVCNGDNCVAQPDPAGDEARLRQRDLLLCVICNSEATEAVPQTQAAVDLKCGFTGPEWDNNSFATQMQACFKGRWYWLIFATMPQMHYDNQDRAKKLAVCKQEASIRSKLPASSSRYSTKPSYTDRDHVTIPCKPGVRYLTGPCATPLPPQTPTATKSRISNPMDHLGDVNAGSGLSSVSGNAGGAQLGRPATPSVTQTSKGGWDNSNGPAATKPSQGGGSGTVFTSQPSAQAPKSGANPTVDYGGCASCGQSKIVAPR